VLISLISLLAITTAIVFVIWRSRRQSIVNVRGRNKHFAAMAKQLSFTQSGDDYFTQLEGMWKGFPIVIYPHNFHGPGSITLFYAESGLPLVERTWIEPNLSLGRAIVDRKRGALFGFEISGNTVFHDERLLESLKNYSQKYPYIAITLPSRFIFSHYVMQTISRWRHFTVFLVLDSGRKPSLEEITQAMDAATDLARSVTELKQPPLSQN
jgi:hypothetical protein